MAALIAEDLLLLLLDDETGAQQASTSTDTLLGGALLVELAIAGFVQLQPSSSRWRSEPDVVLAAGAASTDPLLQQSLDRIAEKHRPAKELLGPLGKGVRDQVTARLADRGILRREDDKVLGLFSRTRWPAADSAHEADVRRRIGQALLRHEQPSAHIAALIALLLGGGELAVLDHEGVSKKDVKKRAEEIAEGDWASEAVGKAVQDALNAAMMAVITTAVIIPAATN